MSKPLSRRRFLSITAGSGIALSCIPVLAANSKPYRWQGIVLGAEGNIQLYLDNKREAKHLTSRCLKEMLRLEKLFSLYDPNSTITELNRNGYVDNPPTEFLTLINEALAYSDLTNGAYDITVQPLWKLYRNHFTKTNPDPQGPSKKEIENVLTLVDYQAINVRPDRIAFDNPDMEITLNGIAQGYITDRVTELLQAHGVDNVLVELGENRALGSHSKGQPWTIGIRAPDSPENVVKSLALNNQAIATSGGYGTIFDEVGIHHHLFNPKTGKSENHHRTLSVVAPNATQADALSTAFYTMKINKIKEIIKKKNGISVFLMASNTHNELMTL